MNEITESSEGLLIFSRQIRVALGRLRRFLTKSSEREKDQQVPPEETE